MSPLPFFQLGSQFEHVDFADLLELTKLVKFDIVVSRVSWLEFLRKRKIQTLECISKVRQLRASLEKLGQNGDELKAIEDRMANFEKNLEEVFEKKLSDLKIGTLKLVECRIEDLLKMSIENTPPFEESNEKGFRDSLIMFSILEAVKGRPDLNALVVSGDKLFAEGILSRQKEYGTSITVVEDLGSAVAHILTLVDEVLRNQRQKEKKEAKDLLLKNQSEIEKAVEKIREFSYLELMDSKLGYIERVVSLKFKDVASATWKSRTEDSATILFALNCQLTVLVSAPWGFLDTRYQVGGGQVITTGGTGKPEEKTIEKIVFGVAEFTKKNGDFQLVRLETDKSLPTEDLVKLISRE